MLNDVFSAFDALVDLEGLGDALRGGFVAPGVAERVDVLGRVTKRSHTRRLSLRGAEGYHDLLDRPALLCTGRPGRAAKEWAVKERRHLAARLEVEGGTCESREARVARESAELS